jgi:acyl-CoA reductase-like NAD-dependent aldehyde dehydrogenase
VKAIMLKVGDPGDAATQVGPVINKAAVERIEGQVEIFGPDEGEAVTIANNSENSLAAYIRSKDVERSTASPSAWSPAASM